MKECHFCLGEFREFHYCKKCYFYVCGGCKAKNDDLFGEGAEGEEAKAKGEEKGKGESVPGEGQLLSQSVNSGLD